MLLHQNIEHVALRVHRSPQIILVAFDRDHDVIKMPLNPLSRAVYGVPDSRIAAQTCGTIRGWIHRSPQCCDRAVSSQSLDS
jgi:hypothetical protein